MGFKSKIFYSYFLQRMNERNFLMREKFAAAGSTFNFVRKETELVFTLMVSVRPTLLPQSTIAAVTPLLWLLLGSYRCGPIKIIALTIADGGERG